LAASPSAAKLLADDLPVIVADSHRMGVWPRSPKDKSAFPSPLLFSSYATEPLITQKSATCLREEVVRSKATERRAM
jgi:hypothetical protein